MSLLLKGVGLLPIAAVSTAVEPIGAPTTNILGGFSFSQDFAHVHPLADNNAIFVFIMADNPPVAVFYGGFNLVEIRVEGFGGNGCAIWKGWNDPDVLPTGSNTVSIQWAGPATKSIAYVQSYKNVDQSAAYGGNTAGTNGTGTSFSDNVTIAEGGLAIGCVAVDNEVITNGVAGGQSELLNTNDSTIYGAVSYNTGQNAGAKAFSASWPSSALYGYCLAEILKA